MKQYRNILILIFLLILSGSISADENIEVLDITEDYIVIRFDLPEWDLQTINVNGEEKQQIVCEQGISRNNPGEPMLLGFTGSIGIPPDGEIGLTVLSSSYRDIDNIRLNAVEKPVQINEELVYQYYEDEEIYSSSSFFPEKIIEKGNTAFSGDRRFSSVFINPFQYNAMTEKLRAYDEIECKIDIYGNKENFRGISTGSILDKVGDELLLNNQYSNNWRYARNIQGTPPPRVSDEINKYMITITSEGIYQVDYEYIISQLEEYELEYVPGFDWDEIDPRYLELNNSDGNVPIYFYGEEDGSFDPGDYFEFYADINHGETAWFDDYSTENIFYLSLENHYGSRMMTENGGLIESNPNNFELPESFEQSIHLEFQNVKDHLGAQTLYGQDYFREDIWFWGSVMAPSLAEFSFNLEYPHDSNIRKASAEVMLMGLTYDKNEPMMPTEQNLHRAIVRINSALIDDIGSNGEWLGQREMLFSNLSSENVLNPILNSSLTNGSNTLSISVPNLVNLYEEILLDYMDLTYWREYKTSSNQIKFHKPILNPIGTPAPMGLHQFNIDGFTTEDITVYKIGSSRFDNITITSLSENGLAPYRVSFQDEVYSNQTEYIAIAEEEKKFPYSIEPDYESSLRYVDSGADYLIISVKEFEEGANLIKSIYEDNASGTAKVVFLQDIFDEFNSGKRSADAIKDFLDYTYNNWIQRPSYCLFLGEGLLDERVNSSYKWANKIPTKTLWFPTRGATASDNWFGCINGDDIVSDISISRLNVTEVSQLEIVAEKIENYLSQPRFEDMWHSSIVLTTGGRASEGSIFSHQSERIRNNSIPPEYRISRIYCNIEDMPQSYGGNTTTLINAINDGSLFVQFIGHGASNQWNDYDLFDINDVANLNNENLFIASSMSCFGSAFFGSAGRSCIGEALTLDPQGAIAQIGFTGYGYKNHGEYYSRSLLSAITNPDLETIGDVIEYTKVKFYAESGYSDASFSLLQGSALLGDPTVKIVRPQRGTTVNTDKYNYALEDTLTISAIVDNDIQRGKFYLFDEDDSYVSANEFYPFTYNAINGQVTRSTRLPDSSILPEGEYNRIVKFTGYSADREVVGITNFAIGYAGAYNLSWNPHQPGPQDEVNVTADFYDAQGVESVECYVRIYQSNIDPFNEEGFVSSYYYEDMVRNNDQQSWQLANPIEALPYNYSVRLEFTITDSLGNSEVCELLPSQSYYRVTGVKFRLSDFEITSKDNYPAVKISVQNDGNRASEECSLKLYDNDSQVLIDSLEIAGLDIGKQAWHYLSLPMLDGSYSFKVVINEEEGSFDGTATLYSDLYELKYFEAGIEETTISSDDGNIICNFPENLLNENVVFKLEKTGSLQAVNQPDIISIALANGELSTAYELKCLHQSVLQDSAGQFLNNKKIELIFNYSNPDIRKTAGNHDRYSVYRWNKEFQKWVFCDMGVNSSTMQLIYLSDKLGTYSIFENNDFTQPAIDVNVEGQNFTFGGYVSRKGIISFLLSDDNGIDVTENKIELSVDGSLVSSYNFTVNQSAGNLISVPVKYQLANLEESHYELEVRCQDFNGNTFSRELDIEVKAEFDIINLANYPNPVKSLTIDPNNSGRTRFTYVLTDDADRVDIKVYTVSGRLVKSFKNLPSSIGYHEYPLSNVGWDCKDEKGDNLANGIYFYRATARKGGKTIEKTQKLAIVK